MPKYTRKETLKSGTVIGYLPSGEWEVISGQEFPKDIAPLKTISGEDITNVIPPRDTENLGLTEEGQKAIKDLDISADFATSTDLSKAVIESLRKVSPDLITQRVDPITRELVPLTPEEMEARALKTGEERIRERETIKRQIGVEKREAEMEFLMKPFQVAIAEQRRKSDIAYSRAKALLARAGDVLDIEQDTALKSGLREVALQGEANIARLQVARERARRTKRLEHLEQASLEIEREEKRLDDMYKDIWQAKKDIWGLQLQEQQEMRLTIQSEWGIVSKLKEGDTWTDSFGNVWTGVKEPDPFFTSANIVKLMLETPMGEERSITDPTTGDVWTIQGLAQKDINTKIYQSTDAAGNVHIIQVNPDTEEVKEIGVIKGAGKPLAAAIGATEEAIQGYMNLVAAGQMELKNVPANVRNQVAARFAAPAFDPTDEKQIESIINEALEAGDDDETIASDLRDLGVSDAIIRKFIIEEKPFGAGLPPLRFKEGGEEIEIEPGEFIGEFAPEEKPLIRPIK